MSALKSKRRKAKSSRAAAPKIPPALDAYLTEQQCRATELQGVLRVISQCCDEQGEITAAWRMSKELSNALDSVNILQAMKAPEVES